MATQLPAKIAITVAHLVSRNDFVVWHVACTAEHKTFTPLNGNYDLAGW